LTQPGGRSEPNLAIAADRAPVFALTALTVAGVKCAFPAALSARPTASSADLRASLSALPPDLYQVRTVLRQLTLAAILRAAPHSEHERQQQPGDEPFHRGYSVSLSLAELRLPSRTRA